MRKKCIKPVALLDDNDYVLTVINTDNMNKLYIKNKIIIYNDEIKARKLYDYLNNKKDNKENKEYHQILGECLGYPQNDVDYFINDHSEYWKEYWSKNDDDD